MRTEGNLRKPAWAADEFGRGVVIEIVYDEGDGLTIARTGQCPYLDNAAAAQNHSHSAFGVFGIVFNRELPSCHYQLEKDLTALLSDGE